MKMFSGHFKYKVSCNQCLSGVAMYTTKKNKFLALPTKAYLVAQNSYQIVGHGDEVGYQNLELDVLDHQNTFAVDHQMADRSVDLAQGNYQG